MKFTDEQWFHRLRGHTIIEREATREDGGLTHAIGRFGAIVPITLTVCSCGAVW